MQKYSKVFKTHEQKRNELLYLTQLLQDDDDNDEPMDLMEKTIHRSFV